MPLNHSLHSLFIINKTIAMKNTVGFLNFKTHKFNNSHDSALNRSLKIAEFEEFCLDLKNILKEKNINNEKLARLIDVPIECLKPLDSNVTDLNLDVLNKILKAIDIQVVIELQIEDF